MLQSHAFITCLQIEKAAELIGYFVPPDTYCKLVLPTMDDSANARQLCVFAAILKGSDRSTVKEKLTDIGNFLKSAEICWNKEVCVTEEIMYLWPSLLITVYQHAVKTVLLLLCL
jgi:hypothetical protein